MDIFFFNGYLYFVDSALPSFKSFKDDLMRFPHFPRRKANAIANGVFFILLGVLFYTQQWWPGILFALLGTFGLRQFLSGQEVKFFVTVLIIGLLTVFNLLGHVFSFVFPLIFLAIGLYYILKECLPFRKPSNNIEEQ
jgi:uncharacterized membrane protein